MIEHQGVKPSLVVGAHGQDLDLKTRRVRGKPRDAILGALVIVIIPNGLGLKTSINPQWQSVITGIVLLLAAAVDAISRRRAARS